MSVVLNRRGLDFDEREREPLVFQPMRLPPDVSATDLTQREGEVMHWLARGKTDSNIAALLSLSQETCKSTWSIFT